mmetsp:Transcript_17928/g.51382  ORF Transcript_17928/g.51382 Transcript_17928/m.51382 type:complete len:273 (-) Transcript_17928:121-939(-)
MSQKCCRLPGSLGQRLPVEAGKVLGRKRGCFVGKCGRYVYQSSVGHEHDLLLHPHVEGIRQGGSQPSVLKVELGIRPIHWIAERHDDPIHPRQDLPKEARQSPSIGDVLGRFVEGEQPTRSTRTVGGIRQEGGIIVLGLGVHLADVAVKVVVRIEPFPRRPRKLEIKKVNLGRIFGRPVERGNRVGVVEKVAEEGGRARLHGPDDDESRRRGGNGHGLVPNAAGVDGRGHGITSVFDARCTNNRDVVPPNNHAAKGQDDCGETERHPGAGAG